MLIAQKKRKENISEYLLYMWQVEDLIRANHFDSDEIRRNLVDRYDQPAAVKEEIARWYEMYYKTLPYIVQLRAKSGGEDIPEIETCFTAVYGYLVLRMQGKEVSAETLEAIKQISAFLALLAEKYKDDMEGKLDEE